MTALHPVKRSVKASVIAQQYGVTERSVRNFIAEPRHEFINRAQERATQIIELRAQNLKIREIAAELKIPYGTVGRVLHMYKKSHQL